MVNLTCLDLSCPGGGVGSAGREGIPEMGELFGESLEAFKALPRPSMEEIGPPAGPPAKRYKRIDREQNVLRAIHVENLVSAEHPVRAIWAMVSQLDLSRFEKSVKVVEGGQGRSHLEPRLLVALWIYAYSEGINAAREIARQCAWEPGFQWLTGLEEVSYHTLSDFRVDHKEALDGIFVDVLALLSTEGLVDIKRVMQDGTKIKAQASGNSYRRRETIEEHRQLAREQVEAMGDPRSEELSQRVGKARQRALREKLERLERACQEIEKIEEQRKATDTPARVSESDPEARIMKQGQGGFASSYNIQVSTDASNKIIVAVAATQAGTDDGQLEDGLNRVEANTGQRPEQMVVDGAYIKNANVEMAAPRTDLYGAMAEKNPEASLKQRGLAPEFYPDQFTYNEAANTVTCPAGKELTLKKQEQRLGGTQYRYRAEAKDCAACPYRQQCCPKNSPRWITRQVDSEAVQAFRTKMETEEAKAICRTRAEVAETPNLWIKEKFGLRQFRLRGLLKVGMEAVWACLTYNILQWARLCWRPKLAAAMAAGSGVRI